MLDEKRRFDMINSFIETNGEETAMALAESLFSTEHATKTDIEALEKKFEAKFGKLDDKMTSHYRWLMSLMITLMGLVITLVAIAFSLRISG